MITFCRLSREVFNSLPERMFDEPIRDHFDGFIDVRLSDAAILKVRSGDFPVWIDLGGNLYTIDKENFMSIDIR